LQYQPVVLTLICIATEVLLLYSAEVFSAAVLPFCPVLRRSQPHGPKDPNNRKNSQALPDKNNENKTIRKITMKERRGMTLEGKGKRNES
jgi:hypothetical protein